MNVREIYNQSCAWTADHCNLCKEESTRGVYPIRSVTDAVVSLKQSTHSVQYRAERGQATTKSDGRGPLVEYLCFLCRRQRRNPRGYDRLRMNAPRGYQPIM
jgi:hypothetical protein